MPYRRFVLAFVVAAFVCSLSQAQNTPVSEGSKANASGSEVLRLGMVAQAFAAKGLPDLADGGENWRSFSPTSLYPGDTISIQHDLSNIGGEDAGNFHIQYYASWNETISNGDHYLGELNVTYLLAGEVVVCDFQGTVPADTPAGPYYVGWVIDSSEQIAEADETNNAVYKLGYLLTVNEPPRYWISGLVKAVDGSPIAGAVVGAGPFGSAPTGADGKYLIEGVAAGEYSLTATLAGYDLFEHNFTNPVAADANLPDYDFMAVPVNSGVVYHLSPAAIGRKYSVKLPLPGGLTKWNKCRWYLIMGEALPPGFKMSTSGKLSATRKKMIVPGDFNFRLNCVPKRGAEPVEVLCLIAIGEASSY